MGKMGGKLVKLSSMHFGNVYARLQWIHVCSAARLLWKGLIGPNLCISVKSYIQIYIHTYTNDLSLSHTHTLPLFLSLHQYL
jgi:hypothetical protein